MKQLCLFAMTIIIFKAHAQDSQVFISKYLPGHQYKATNHIEIKLTASIKGDKQIIDQLSAKGITSPLNVNLISVIQGTVITDSTITNKYFNCFLGYRIPDIDISV